MAMASGFYLRYYVGHKGKFGHEFLEFEFRPDGEQRRGRWRRPQRGAELGKEARRTCSGGGGVGRAASAGCECAM